MGACTSPGHLAMSESITWSAHLIYEIWSLYSHGADAERKCIWFITEQRGKDLWVSSPHHPSWCLSTLMIMMSSSILRRDDQTRLSFRLNINNLNNIYIYVLFLRLCRQMTPDRGEGCLKTLMWLRRSRTETLICGRAARIYRYDSDFVARWHVSVTKPHEAAVQLRQSRWIINVSASLLHQTRLCGTATKV